MPKAFLSEKHQTFLRALGADLRSLREQSDLTQETVGEIFGWNKDAISKVERGVNTLSVYDFLRIIMFFRDMVPDHPGLALATRYGMRN